MWFFGFVKNAQIRNIGAETAKKTRDSNFIGDIAVSNTINGCSFANISGRGSRRHRGIC
jgi:hypothetical protein